MEYEQDESLDNDGFMQRIKESPRTVSALIIILIVAAAIYAFSGEETPPGQDEQAGQAATETQDRDEQAQIIDDETMVSQQAGEQTDGAVEIPDARRSETAFVEVAQAGDGVTHLARRAASRYLSENNAGYEVTNEHRIFIEDYLKDATGSQGLSLGQEVEISFDLISEAVAAAGELNEMQLQNLSQYTTALST